MPPLSVGSQNHVKCFMYGLASGNYGQFKYAQKFLNTAFKRCNCPLEDQLDQQEKSRSDRMALQRLAHKKHIFVLVLAPAEGKAGFCHEETQKPYEEAYVVRN